MIEEDHESSSRERDLCLLSDKVDLNDPELTAAFKKYFDRTSTQSNRVEYCGVALVGFDADFYPGEDEKGVAEDIAKAAKAGMATRLGNVSKRLLEEKMQHFDIQLLCVPMPSAEGFRASFLEALGLKHEK